MPVTPSRNRTRDLPACTSTNYATACPALSRQHCRVTGVRWQCDSLNCQTPAAGSAMAQAMNDRPISAETRGSIPGQSIRDLQWTPATGFSPATSVSPISIIPPTSILFWKFCTVWQLGVISTFWRNVLPTPIIHEITYHSHTKMNDFKTCISESPPPPNATTCPCGLRGPPS